MPLPPFPPVPPSPFGSPPIPGGAPTPPPIQGDGEGKCALSERDREFFGAEDAMAPAVPESDPVPLRKKITCWLVSAVVNILALILLGLILFPLRPKPLVVDAVFSESLGDQLDTLTLDEGNTTPVEAAEYAFTMPEEAEVNEVVVFEKEEKDFIENVDEVYSEMSRVDITDLFSGRTDPGTKNDLLSKYGGNHLTTEAVRRGLVWLKKQQDPAGFWSLVGPYRDGVSSGLSDNRAAATGLALLAFQGDGNTRHKGDYSKVVAKAWRWLLAQQGDNGGFFQEGSSSGRFYTQAVCTIAVCELVAMEKGDGKGADVRSAAQKAVDYLVERQNTKLGGWRYDVETTTKWVEGRVKGTRVSVDVETAIDSDLSVTGWVLMSLVSARAAGLYVPQDTLDNISKLLDSLSQDGGASYCYRADETDFRASMTATGLLCREYLGWDKRNPELLRGAAILVDPKNTVRFPPSNQPERRVDSSFVYTNVYGWYSSSMALKYLGPAHAYWQKWNAALNSEIPAHQVPDGQAEAGSWDPFSDEYFFGGGRLYVTCLSILCMEVYYRHLSLSQPKPASLKSPARGLGGGGEPAPAVESTGSP